MSILLAAVGLWFLLEGAMYAAAPDAMKKFGAWLAELSEDQVRQSGLFSMAIGAILLYVMVRF